MSELNVSGALKKSWKGILLFISMVALLWWNEGRAVSQRKSIFILEDHCISVDASELNKAFDHPVHFMGNTSEVRSLYDPEINAPLVGIRFKKHVLKAKYEKDTLVWRTVGEGTHLGDIKISNIRLGKELLTKLYDFEPLELPGIENRFSFIDSNDILRHGVLIGEGSYVHPKLGDKVIYYDYIPHGTYSVIGMLEDGIASNYETGHYPICLIEKGSVSMSDMLKNAHSSNTFTTWFLRGLGMSGMFYSLMLMFTFLLVLTSKVPVLGKIAHWSAKALAGAFTGVFGSLIIGIAWLYYRPLVALVLLGATLLLIFIFHRMAKNN